MKEKSSTIGERIRNVRESLGMGRQEFVDRTGILKNSLIAIETGRNEPGSKSLMAIASAFPEYAAYLLINDVEIKQKNPEAEGLGTAQARMKKAA
jgi:transcriptional regulator with XRE-family HTH domain